MRLANGVCGVVVRLWRKAAKLKSYGMNYVWRAALVLFSLPRAHPGLKSGARPSLASLVTTRVRYVAGER